jgi:hypothetical protein
VSPKSQVPSPKSSPGGARRAALDPPRRGLWTLNFPALAFLLLGLAGCGALGEPQPPLLNLPQPTEITAVQRGDRVLIDWTPPLLTTEGQAIRAEKLGPAEIYRAVFPGLRREVSAQQFQGAAARLAELPALQSHSSVEVKPAGAAHTEAFAVRLLNQHGHGAGFSNIVAVPILPAPPAPTTLQAKSAEKALVLRWPAAPGASSYHVYRSEAAPGAPPAPLAIIATVERPEYADENFQFGHDYRYLVRAVVAQDGFTAESADSPVAALLPKDVFPPRVPSGLAAIVTEPGVPSQVGPTELSWEPNTEPDLAGYNLYRSEAGGPPRRLNNQLLTSPAFRDESVKPGIAYTYSVTAIDQSGNESARSQPVTVPP